MLEVRSTLPPVQNVVLPVGVIIGVEGEGLTVTVFTAETAVHPEALLTVTVKFPDVETVIDCVVAPVDHAYVVAALDVSRTLPPAQKVVGPPAVIIGVPGLEFTITVVVAEVAEQPGPLLTVTE